MDHSHHQDHGPHKHHKETHDQSHSHGDHGMHSDQQAVQNHKAHPQTETRSSDHLNHAEHGAHNHHHQQDFLKRFWVSVILTVPVLLLSHMIQQWTGIHIHFPGDNILLLLLSTAIFLYGGAPFIKGCVEEIRERTPGMMTLVAVAISAAYIYSTAVILGLEGMDFFWELATLIDIMLLGHWLEMKSQMSASRALESLVKLMPSTAHVEIDGEVNDIPLKELQANSIAIVKPGEKIPADGKVLDGVSFVNESMMTGESVPVKKEKGESVIGGAVNGDGSLRIQVTGAGDNSYLHKVIRLVQSAQENKSKTQHLANKVAKWLTIVSLTVGVITLVVWIMNGSSFAFAMERMVTVMVTSCPHALGVAIPLVVAISTSLSAANGLLIRNRTAFENARLINTIIFDKTGTLTKGAHEVQSINSLHPEYTPEKLLQLAAAVQQHSEHHIAAGIMKKLREQKLALWPSEGFSYMQGMGVSAVVNGSKVTVAGPNFFTSRNIALPESKANRDVAGTIVYILVDNQPAGFVILADAIRETSRTAIERLKKMNIRSILLTGDNENVASSVARQLNMDGYFANVLPHEKQEKIKELQKKGEIVAMTGDGVNDAPALAQADVGIAVGSGTDVAAETADIILVNSDPEDVVQAISFAKATYRKMIQNLGWAIGYNVVAIPLAAGILYPHFVLSPALGAILMSLSTVVVAINAQLLRKSLHR